MRRISLTSCGDGALRPARIGPPTVKNRSAVQRMTHRRVGREETGLLIDRQVLQSLEGTHRPRSLLAILQLRIIGIDLIRIGRGGLDAAPLHCAGQFLCSNRKEGRRILRNPTL
jgi:hypothetical protein